MAGVDTTRIVVVCPTVLDNDAVGNATLALVDDLIGHGAESVTLLARNSDRKHDAIVLVDSLGDLLLNKAFLDADVIIYVFAIYSELFDAMLIGNSRAAQVVRFHNVTPKAFVDKKDHAIIDRSVAQLQNFSDADDIWADSQENRDELLRQGIDANKIRIMPLSVTPLAVARLADKPTDDAMRLLYVGRFVQSKGLEDLLEALSILKRRDEFPFRAQLVGSTRHSQRPYLDRLAKLTRDNGLETSVQMVGTVTTTVLSEAYRAAHIVTTASRHEGFCVPIIEGMAAGCVPVTYGNSNLKYISAGLGRLADHDTPQALAEALALMGRAIRQSVSDKGHSMLPVDREPLSPAGFDQAAAAHVATFSREICAARTRLRISELAGSALLRDRAHVSGLVDVEEPGPRLV